MTLCDFNKLSSEILPLSWRRNVLHFAAAARIIGRKMRGGKRHDLHLQDCHKKADERSLCFRF